MNCHECHGRFTNREVLQRSRVARLLGGFPSHPAAIKFGQMNGMDLGKGASWIKPTLDRSAATSSWASLAKEAWELSTMRSIKASIGRWRSRCFSTHILKTRI